MIALDDALVTAYSPDPAGGADRVVRLLGPVTLELVEHRVAIVGANGSGKSTLARLLNGLVLPSSGTVRVDGLDTARDGAAVRRRVGFMFTDPDAQLVMPTPVEDVALSLRRLPMSPAERDVAARAALARFGLAASFLTIHPAGIVGLMVRLGISLSEALAIDVVYWPGDVLKNFAAAAVAVAIFKAFPDMLRSRR